MTKKALTKTEKPRQTWQMTLNLARGEFPKLADYEEFEPMLRLLSNCSKHKLISAYQLLKLFLAL